MSSQIIGALNGVAGKAQKSQGESLNSFLASIATSGFVLGLGWVAYLFIRWRFPHYYHQRSFQLSGARWSPAPISFHMLLRPMPDPDANSSATFENYLFDRYLHVIVRIFLPLSLVLPPFLIPLHLVDGRNSVGGVKGLDRLSLLNISPVHTGRYWMHLSAAIFVIVYVCCVIQRELRDYNRLRTIVIGSIARPVLLSSGSTMKLSVDDIHRHFQTTSGGVRQVIINRDYKTLDVKLRKRNTCAENLEKAETSLIRSANRIAHTPENHLNTRKIGSPSLWSKYISPESRPTTRLRFIHFLPPLPFIGLRVDAIYQFRAELVRRNGEIEYDQQHPEIFPEVNSALVYFNSVPLRSTLALAIKAQIPSTWTLRLGTTSTDILWCNISISWWQRHIRATVAYLSVATLTFSFVFPVAAIGSLSQLGYLANVVPGLARVGKLPGWSLAVIQGVLPPLMLALITAFAPLGLRFIASAQGMHSREAVERQIQVYYFLFLFVQVFLIISLSAGITAIFGQLTDGERITPAIAVYNMPKASNYFLSFIIIYTYTSIVGIALSLFDLINLIILSPLFDKTARQKWKRLQSLGVQSWGTFLPAMTNIACIGLIYSVIAPLILPFIVLCFGSFLKLYRICQPRFSGSNLKRGLFYPTAIRQLFMGVYFLEFCLAGLFLLVRDEENKPACTLQASILLTVAGLTGLFHCALDYNHKLNFICAKYREKLGEERMPTLGIEENNLCRAACPTLWIPKDEIGISDDEASHIRKAFPGIPISSEGARFTRDGGLELTGPPPDSF